MDLKISGQRFLVCGASSGFGCAIARQLLQENASLILTARRESLLKEKFSSYGDRVEILAGDLTNEDLLTKIEKSSIAGPLHGILINAGGPPAGTPLETTMNQWDDAYQLVMRWKIDLVLHLAPVLAEQGYGRILFIESKSVKQPIPELVLSNAFRAGVAGFAKSLATELAGKGITVNILAPGAHDTPAIERVIKKRSESAGISYEQAKEEMEQSIPIGRMGSANELASLAVWLLSPRSGYVTGQTISHDGGSVAGLFG
ncbi:MAG: SDR family oxidoreductase [Balneolaceae bacterium]